MLLFGLFLDRLNCLLSLPECGMSWHDTLLFSECICMRFNWLWCVLPWGAVKFCQPGGVWAGLWLDSLCGRQNSMNQTLIVSSPQETIRCLTNHVSVFLPTPSPFTQLCSLINVWWKWWETDGHSLPLLSVHTDQSPLPDHTKCTVNCPFTLMPSLCYDICSSNPEETRNQTSRACI